MNSRMSKFGLAGLLSASLLLAGCGGSSEQVSEAAPAEADSTSAEVEAQVVEEVESQPSEESGDIEVDEGLFSTEVTLPLSLFTFGQDESATPPSQEELQASLDEEGRNIQATVNENGTVTYRMSRSEYNKFKADLKASIDESIQTALDEEANIYKSVTYDNDLREFEVTVDRKALESAFSFFGFGLLVTAGFYQAFTGVQEGDRFVLINYVDEKTGEVFDTYDSRTLQDQN